jgi:hypothetical protein
MPTSYSVPSTTLRYRPEKRRCTLLLARLRHNSAQNHLAPHAGCSPHLRRGGLPEHPVLGGTGPPPATRLLRDSPAHRWWHKLPVTLPALTPPHHSHPSIRTPCRPLHPQPLRTGRQINTRILRLVIPPSLRKRIYYTPLYNRGGGQWSPPPLLVTWPLASTGQ